MAEPESMAKGTTAPSSARDGVTDDAFLGGALRIFQPRAGFRSGLDAVVLAAAVPAENGGHALEAGAGVGVAGLCLARRVAGLRVDGLEIDPALAALAARNAERNGLAERVMVHAGDVGTPPDAVTDRQFDHVLANPPFFEAGRAFAARDDGRARARMSAAGGLAQWLDFCLRRVASGGTVTVLHRAEAVGRLLGALDGPLGGLRIFPLWPRAGVAAKRVIVCGRKGSRAPLKLLAGLVLHGEGGGFTPRAEAVLRDGAGLVLD